MVPADPQSTSDAQANPPQSAQAILPQVQPPTATFILQLFLIPLAIVTCVIMLFLGFRWMASATSQDPKQAIQSLQQAEGGSWQKAYELADMLGNPDPQFDKLRESSELAKEISRVLDDDLKAPLSAELTEEHARRRMFLCRALGTFKVADGIPSLTRAVKHGTGLRDLQVRLSAIESIALLAKGIGPEKVQQLPDTMAAILEASRTSGEAEAPPQDLQPDDPKSIYNPYSEVRAIAAYALGIIGGPEATARLEEMLADTYPNARYNASTGLARTGSSLAIGVIGEMLDPDNVLSSQDEGNTQDREKKRTQVLFGGLQATLALHRAQPSADLSALKPKIELLMKGEMKNIKANRGKLVSYAKETFHIVFEPAK